MGGDWICACGGELLTIVGLGGVIWVGGGDMLSSMTGCGDGGVYSVVVGSNKS